MKHTYDNIQPMAAAHLEPSAVATGMRRVAVQGGTRARSGPRRPSLTVTRRPAGGTFLCTVSMHQVKSAQRGGALLASVLRHCGRARGSRCMYRARMCGRIAPGSDLRRANMDVALHRDMYTALDAVASKIFGAL